MTKLRCSDRIKEKSTKRGGTALSTIEIQSLPEIRFAHAYHAQSYENTFPILNDRIEVSYISEGSTTIACNGVEYVAKKGTVICLPYHHKIHIRSDSYHEHRTVQARLKWRESDLTSGLYLPILTPAEFHTKTAAGMIDQLISNQLLFKESPTKGAILFLDLLAEIDRCNRNAEKMNLPSDVRYATHAKEFVQSNLRSPITQKSVAQYLSITPEYLCSVFKKVEGISFQKYVNYEKLEAIKNLIEKEQVYLYEAAAMFGYSDPNYVSRLFKKYYGYNITDKQNRHPTIAE